MLTFCLFFVFFSLSLTKFLKPLQCGTACPDGCDGLYGKCDKDKTCVNCVTDPCALIFCGPGDFCFRDYCGGCTARCYPQGCAEDLKICPDGTTLERNQFLKCEFPECPALPTTTEEPMVCTLDVKECPDGSFVGRDPNNNCEFYPCPLVCTKDAKECWDGSFVGRDSNNNCEFFPCPSCNACEEGCDGSSIHCPVANTCVNCFADPCMNNGPCSDSQRCFANYCGGCNAVCEDIFCTLDVKTCPDGSFVSRDPSRGCAFRPCPEVTTEEPIFCTLDAKQCWDGSFVGRDSNNNCEFFPCPACVACKEGCDGSSIHCPKANSCVLCAKDPCSINNGGCRDDQRCVANYCGGCNAVCDDIACTLDVKECPDGSFVGRDPSNNCEFFPCPVVTTEEPIFCTLDVKECPDGSFVGRDPNNNCEFFPCPKCCDPKLEPGRGDNPFCIEGHVCCQQTGEWVCSIGDGRTFPCPDNPTGPFGKACEELDTTEEPIFCTLDAKQCWDGSFVGRDPNNNCEFFPCPPCSACREGCDGSSVHCPKANSCFNCFVDPCSINNGGCRDDQTCTANYCGGCNAVCEDIFCTDDVFECPDGSYVSRDPSNNCEFHPCPVVTTEEPKICADDVKECRDGSFVGRDPERNCRFFRCPKYRPRSCGSACPRGCNGRNDRCPKSDVCAECLVDPCATIRCSAEFPNCVSSYCDGQCRGFCIA